MSNIQWSATVFSFLSFQGINLSMYKPSDSPTDKNSNSYASHWRLQLDLIKYYTYLQNEKVSV